jgi:hypothetical protein
MEQTSHRDTNEYLQTGYIKVSKGIKAFPTGTAINAKNYTKKQNRLV